MQWIEFQNKMICKANLSIVSIVTFLIIALEFFPSDSDVSLSTSKSIKLKTDQLLKYMKMNSGLIDQF